MKVGNYLNSYKHVCLRARPMESTAKKIRHIVELINMIYENISVYQGIIVYHPEKQKDVDHLMAELKDKDYPVIMYSDDPLCVRLREDMLHDMLKYRMFIISCEELTRFFEVWGPFYENINFVLTLGKNVMHMFKARTCHISPPYRQVCLDM